jgi:hypothetical protein
MFRVVFSCIGRASEVERRFRGTRISLKVGSWARWEPLHLLPAFQRTLLKVITED